MSKYFSVYEQRLNSITEKYTTLAEQEFSTPQQTYNVLSKKTEPYTAKDLRDLGTAAIAGVIISDEVAKKAQDDWADHVVPEIRNRYPQIEIAGRSEWSMTAHMPNVIANAAKKRNACSVDSSYNGFNDYFASNVGLMGCARNYPKNPSLVKLVNQVRKIFSLEPLNKNPYNDELVAKIKKFQSENGIRPDGDYGIETHSVTQNTDIPDLKLKFPYKTLSQALQKADKDDISFSDALSNLTNTEVSWATVDRQILPDLLKGINKQFEIFDGLFKTYYDAADNLGVEPINPFAAFNPGTGDTHPLLAKLSWNDWKKVYDLVKSGKVKSNDPNFTPLEKAVVQIFPNNKELEKYIRRDSEQVRSADPLRAYVRDVLRPQINQTLPYLNQLVPLAQDISTYQKNYEALRELEAAERRLKKANQAQERFNQRDLNISNRIAAARGAEEQGLYGPDDDAPLSQGEQGYRDQDFFGADDDAPLSQAERGARDQDLYGGDADRAATSGIAAGRAIDDQDFYGDPEDFGPGGTGVGRSDERGGYLEMARREFDKALANTKGPTRGDGALETARRAFDTAIKNTPGPTRGDYGARLEMSKRAFVQALKNTLDTGRGSGFKEMARRAFDTALKNTLDTGRGSGENEVDRRFVDNVRRDIDQWMNRNRAPGETTGGFVGVSIPGSDSDRPSGEEQIETQRELHRNIVNMFDAEQGKARASFILSLVRKLGSNEDEDEDSDSKLLNPENREKYINNLKQTYVKYKAQEDFLRSQEGNPTLYYGFNPGNLSSVEGVMGRSNFNLSDSILYSLELLTQVVPNAIQKHSTEQSVIDANPPVELDKDQLDQEAQARTAELDQAAQELRDQGAARTAAGEEELANRDEIRARAEQDAERRRIIADQLKTFKEIEADTTSKEAAFDAVIKPLELLVSNIESNVVGTQISSLVNLQVLFDAEYDEKADIITNAINGKEQFEELDERLYNVVVEKLTKFNEETNTVLNRLKAADEGEDASIRADDIFNIDTTSMRADVDAFSMLKDMPLNFVSIATKRIDQIDSLADKLQKRYKFYNDEFMVLHREVRELILSVWDNIDDISYDELVDLNEDIEELFELSQVTGRTDREQQIVDNKYDSSESNLSKLIQRKALDFAKRVRDVRNDIVTKTRVDAVNIIEGDLVLTPEAFDELYNRRDEVADLVEEFDILEEFLESVDTEEPEYFTQIRGWFDTLAQFYQTIEQYAAGRGGPNRRGSPSDAYRYYKKTLRKVKEPARAGFAGRGAPSPESRHALVVKHWDRRDSSGLPKANSQGDTSEGARKKQHRKDIRALIKAQGSDGVKKLLAGRRLWQLSTGNFADNPYDDVLIKTTKEAMRLEQSEFERGEIKDLGNRKRAAAYLDKLKDQYYG